MDPHRPEDLKPIFIALRHIIRAVRVASHEAEATLGISGAQLFVLQQLVDNPRISLRELASLTLTDQSSVSVVVARLVRRRLVARKISAADARRVEVSLTAKGQALLKQAPDSIQVRLLRSFKGVPSKELVAFQKTLTRVVKGLAPGAGPAELFFESKIASSPREPFRGRRLSRRSGLRPSLPTKAPTPQGTEPRRARSRR